MKTLERESFKNDMVFNFFYQQILKNHKPANHTEKTLFENKHIHDFCEVAQHFSVIELDKELTAHISYDVNSWYNEGGSAKVRVESITLYDNFDEYETIRKTSIYKAKNSDIPTFDQN